MAKSRGRYRDFPYAPYADTCGLPHYQHPPPAQVVCLLQLTNLHWTLYRQNSIGYIPVHSWCCTFYGSGQTCDGM